LQKNPQNFVIPINLSQNWPKLPKDS